MPQNQSLAARRDPRQSPAVGLPDGWKTPDLTLILAATPRSGSNWLASLVDSTGLFRNTDEYFNRGLYLERDGLRDPSLGHMMAEMDRRTRTGANFLSTKLFPVHMTRVMTSDLLAAAFANARYVHLVRRDILGQAISLARASGTGKWVSDSEGNGTKPEYDEADISRHIAILCEAERWWRIFFAARDVPVLQIVYEELEADPIGEVGRIVSFLGMNPGQYAPNMSELRLTKQRDDINEAWRRRYLASNADPSAFHGERPVPRTFRNLVRFLKGELSTPIRA